MLRKVKELQVDTTNTDQSYWDNILKTCGLSMKRGISPIVKYFGGTRELDAVSERNAEMSFEVGGRAVNDNNSTRKVKPEGHGDA